jgi:D-serine deaminase-like pyridoxal phosphate-dependent protein
VKSDRYARYVAALRDEPLPAAAIDLDAFERNIDTLVAPVRRQRKTLRVASKSLRSASLLRRILERGGNAVKGILAFSPQEACWLVEQGFDDIVVAYPTLQARDAECVARKVAGGARIALLADGAEHLALASSAARAAGTRLPIVVDVDVSYRPIGERLHLGVRRSSLREPEAVADFVERVLGDPALEFAGLQGYEAQLASVQDVDPFAPVMARAKRVVKRLSRGAVRSQRKAIVDELTRRGIAVPLFNGGGSGSVLWSSRDPSLSEVAAGSGFLDSHLFDGFHGLELEPAAFFTLQVTRRPASTLVTCQSGGFVASGVPGPDRLPLPYLPEGLELLGFEGAGEVQTPLRVAPGTELGLGDLVVFRHAKAGELAEHFTSYALIRGDRIEARAPTYRGEGVCFH